MSVSTPNILIRWALLLGLSPAFTPFSTCAQDPAPTAAGVGTVDQETTVVQPELESFTPLWTRSLFTSGVAPAPPPQPQIDTEWARSLSLLGWTDIDGVVTVYLYRADTEDTFVLTKGAIPEEGVMQAVEIENPESLLASKARVRLNGHEALIGQFESTVAIEPPAKDSPPPAGTIVHPPTTVDSRAQRLTEPVLFTEDNTFEKSLQPSRGGAAGKPAEASPASEVIHEMRQRNELLYDQYPRPNTP